ncbi:hypothetical protein ABID12_000609 [Martelella mangrovi]|uniref:GcrA cell cycle regulator n=1 Tax=Martelella mangrovi TaxID=1397477 RepID=A0ABV2I8U6_9HYPH
MSDRRFPSALYAVIPALSRDPGPSDGWLRSGIESMSKSTGQNMLPWTPDQVRGDGRGQHKGENAGDLPSTFPIDARQSHLPLRLAPNTLSRLRERCPERGSEGEAAFRNRDGVRVESLPPHCRFRDISPLRGEKTWGLCGKAMCGHLAFKDKDWRVGLAAAADRTARARFDQREGHRHAA